MNSRDLERVHLLPGVQPRTLLFIRGWEPPYIRPPHPEVTVYTVLSPVRRNPSSTVAPKHVLCPLVVTRKIQTPPGLGTTTWCNRASKGSDLMKYLHTRLISG